MVKQSTTINKVYKFYKQFPEHIGKLKALSRFGYNEIEACEITAKNSEVIQITTESGIQLKTSPNHRLLSNGCNWEFVKNLKLDNVLFSKNNIEKIKHIEKLNYKDNLYDMQIKNVHEFYANNIVSHNSSIQESLYFVFTGKPYRSVKKAQLVNTTNGKNLLVELEIQHGGSDYLIRRGVKPNIFEIYKDDELINEESHIKDYQAILENMLGMSAKTFKQTIIMSSRYYTPFLDLAAYEKREFIENIFSIKLFSQMVETLKRKSASLKMKLKDLTKDVERVNSNISLLSKIEEERKAELEKQRIDIIKQIKKAESEIENLESKLVENSKLNSVIQGKINKLKRHLPIGDKIKNEISKNKLIRKQGKEKIKFYETNDTCPSCNRIIEEDLKQKEISEVQESLVKIDSTIQNLEYKLSEFSKLVKTHDDLEDKSSAIESNTLVVESNIKFQQKAIKNLKKTANKLSEPIVTNGADPEELKKDLDELNQKIFDLNKVSKYIKVTMDMLSEKGIKRYIIQKYVPVLNSLLNEYLALFDAPYSVVFDEELKETIIARGYDDLSYYNLSSGEKQRLDSALIFAFLDLSRMKNSVDTNLIWFDEVLDQSLDDSGINGIFKIFQRLKTKGYTIFVISHRENIGENFDRNIKVTKKQFSSISEE